MSGPPIEPAAGSHPARSRQRPVPAPPKIRNPCRISWFTPAMPAHRSAATKIRESMTVGGPDPAVETRWTPGSDDGGSCMRPMATRSGSLPAQGRPGTKSRDPSSGMGPVTLPPPVQSMSRLRINSPVATLRICRRPSPVFPSVPSTSRASLPLFSVTSRDCGTQLGPR